MEADDSLPLKKGATKLVFGVGDPETKILFIGEGPGYYEDQSGEPFVGQAGKFLNTLLGSINMTRESVYITNVVHHRPPENRDPTDDEMGAYGRYLDEMVKIIDPQIIITLGRFSMGKFLPTAKISTSHGKVSRVNWMGREITVVPMYHPAASLRNGEVMRQEKADFLKLPEILKQVQEEAKNKEPEVEQMNLI